MKSYCIGYEGYACGKVVYTGERCGPCGIAHTHVLKLQASPETREESYRRCELNGCMQMIQFGVNGMGYTTMICPTHGERLMPRGPRGQREIEAA